MLYFLPNLHHCTSYQKHIIILCNIDICPHTNMLAGLDEASNLTKKENWINDKKIKLREIPPNPVLFSIILYK